MHPVSNRRGAALRALAVSAIALAGLAGCTMVGDRLTGLSLTRDARGTCITDCANAASASIEAEVARHADNVLACQELPAGDRDACLSAEGARFAAAMQAITDARLECHNNCHSQGQGSAG